MIEVANRSRRALAAALCAAAIGAVHAGRPAIPPTPAPAKRLVAARSFTLQESYRHRYSAHAPQVDSGYLLVLEVDPELVRPRQSAEPVLYVGDLTAERLNAGHRSGRLVVIVPARVDLTASPIWFGQPNLPERVDPETALAQRALAEAAGLRPFGAKAVAAALSRGGGPLDLNDIDALLREAGRLVLRFAPDEAVLAKRWNAPAGAWTERRRPAP